MEVTPAKIDNSRAAKLQMLGQLQIQLSNLAILNELKQKRASSKQGIPKSPNIGYLSF